MLSLDKVEILQISLMTKFCLLIVFAFHVPDMVKAADKPELRLTSEVISQRYCEGDVELDALALELKLLYENVGSQTLILYKGSDQIVQVIVSRSHEDAVAGKNELNSTLSWYTDGSERRVDESSLRKAFVILSPGDVYETKTEARVFVTREGVGQIVGAVGDGEHHLQVTIPTWYGSQQLADTLRKKWQRGGFLWTNSNTSFPMKFKVESRRKVTPCY